MRLVLMFWVLVSFGAQAQAQQMDCTDAVTQVDMTDCAKLDFDAADEALNISYQVAMDMMTSIDGDLPEAEQGAVESLRTAQRAWIIVRDNTCAAEGFGWAGGSGRGLAELTCWTRLTTARIDDLNILAEPY